MRPLKITAPIESDSEISFRDMVNRKIECLTEVHSEVVGIKYGYTGSDAAHGIVR